jgi:hypothetical protein
MMMARLLVTMLCFCSTVAWAGEYETSYATTCARYQARVADLFGGPVAPIVPTNPAANYIANGNYKYLIAGVRVVK